MRSSIFRPFVLFFWVVLSLFSYGAVADERQVYELINAAFPPPRLVIKPDIEKALPTALPPLFRSGHGLFMSASNSLKKVDFVAHDSDDPLGR